MAHEKLMRVLSPRNMILGDSTLDFAVNGRRGISIEQIARDNEVSLEQLRIGIRQEMQEHKTSAEKMGVSPVTLAVQIAVDHLKEDAHYYERESRHET